ncbi:MAG: hypothetical protein ACXWZ6_05585 [Solirubrobacterales bacterium]
MKKLIQTTLALLALAAGLAACGGEDENEETRSGAFELLAETPSGFGQLSGDAEMTRSDDGTEVSVQLAGLRPDTEYVSHVHSGTCDQLDAGGPHFKFDLNGPEEPPNEIHLMFTSDAEGVGEASASNDQRVPDEEGNTVVLHLEEATGEDVPEHEHAEGEGKGEHTHSHSVKIACATLE